MYATIKNFYVQQCDFQHWANDALFSSLDLLDDATRRENRGLARSSLHQTVDHMWVIAHNWSNRVRGASAREDSDAIHHQDWKELKLALRREVRSLQHYIENQPDGFFEEKLNYTGADGREHCLWVRDALCHVMSHLTLHRGEVCAGITQCGLAAPRVDFVSYKEEIEASLAAIRSREAGQS